MGHFIVEGISTRVKSPMKIHGRFYLSKKTPDYKMTHQLFTLFWIISNILTFHFYTFSVIYTFYRLEPSYPQVFRGRPEVDPVSNKIVDFEVMIMMIFAECAIWLRIQSEVKSDTSCRCSG